MDCKYNNNIFLNDRLFLFTELDVLFGDETGLFTVLNNPQVLQPKNIEYNESESLDERYKFERTITATFDGEENRTFDNGKFKVAIMDKNKSIYLCNPDLNLETSTEYILDSEGERTVLTFHILSNFALLRNDGFTDYSLECNSYSSKIKPETVKIKKHGKSWIDDYNREITTDGSDFTELSCYGIEVHETINDKGNITRNVNLKMNIDSNSEIIELLMLPSNKWNLIVTASDGKYVYLGFHEYGLQCNYEISDNVYNVTFTENCMVPLSTGNYGYSASTYTFWRYIDKFQKCVGGGYAIPTLQAEMDILGRETGYYKCYVDLLDFFVHLGYNIVDTFSTAPLRKSDSCAEQLCPAQVDKRLIEFTELIDTVEMSLQTNCPWSISGIPSWLEVSPDYGTGNTDIEFISTSSANTSTTIYLNVEGGQSISIDVTNGMGSPFQNNYNVNAKYQQVTVNVTGFTVVNSDLPYSTTSSSIIYDVPENRSTSSRTFTSTVLYNSKQITITIEQAGIQQKWQDTTGFICESGDTYYRQELLLSYDGQTWFSGNQYRPSGLAVEGQDLCSGYLERWVQNGYFCFEGEQYHALVLQTSTDGGTTWTDTMEMNLGTKVNQSAQQHYAECGKLEERWIISDKTYCKIDD